MLDLYFFFLGLSVVVAEVASFPTESDVAENQIAAAVIGKPATFGCRPAVTFPAVDWRFQSSPDENEVQLCKDGYLVNGYAKTFKIESPTAGEFNLVIPAVLMNSSGLYTCVEEAGLGRRHRTEFVVFASPPVCATNLSASGHIKDSDIFEIHCDVTYYGNCVPVFKCAHKNTEGSTSSQRVPHSISYSKVVTASADVDNTNFSCSLEFTCDSEQPTVYKSSQLYQYAWSTPVIHITGAADTSRPRDSLLYGFIAIAVILGAFMIAFIVTFIKLVRTRMTKCHMAHYSSTQNNNHVTRDARSQTSDENQNHYMLLAGDDSNYITRGTSSVNVDGIQDAEDIPLVAFGDITNVDDLPCMWNCLPMEVIEMLLMKTFIGFFIREFKTSDAEKTAFMTVCSVSDNWWNTFRGWPHSDTSLWLKRTLRRCLKYLYKPYCRSPKLLTRLSTTGWVCGIAHLQDRTFVVSSTSDKVLVFDEQYNHQSDILVKGLRKPQGIVACRDTCNLYISDSLMNHIWQITPDGVVNVCVIFDVDQHGAKSKSRMASISSRRLLVILPPNKLVVYGLDNGDRTHVNLPSRMDVQHAVETAEQTYVISHVRPGAVKMHQISEVNSGGEVIRSFGYQRGSNPEQLDSPEHVILDGRGQILVADMFNNRVLVLNSQLKLQRILLAEKEGLAKPHFLCFNEAQGHLLVGEWLCPSVKVFRVGKCDRPCV